LFRVGQYSSNPGKAQGFYSRSETGKAQSSLSQRLIERFPFSSVLFISPQKGKEFSLLITGSGTESIEAE